MKILWVMNQVRGGWAPSEADGWAGGEETAVGASRAFAAKGHEVTVLWDGPALMDGPVEYLTAAMLGTRTFDVALFFKCPELAPEYLRLAPKRFLWTDQERAFNPDPFDLIGACSLYLARLLASLVPRAATKLDVVPYAYDYAELSAQHFHGEVYEYQSNLDDPYVAKDPNLVLTTSSPDRGLGTLLRAWPKVLERHPQAKLRCTYGWDVFDKIGGPASVKAEISALLAACGDSVTFGRVSRDELHRLYWQAGVWAYYCTGGEQFGLSAIKAQAAGCVPVVKPWGALHETVWSGIKVADEQGLIDGLVAALDPETQAKLRAEVVASDNPYKTRTFADVVGLWESRFADPVPAIPVSHLREVPGAPPFANPPGWNWRDVAMQGIQGWLSHLQAQRPWVDPSLGFGNGPAATPAEADAVVLGFALEAADTAPRETLKALGLPQGVAVLCLTSHGPWRAQERQRLLLKRDLQELIGKLPDAQVQATALDPPGNGLMFTSFRYLHDRIGERDLARAARSVRPRETLAACLIVRNNELTLPRTLATLRPVIDQLCVVDTGSTDGTREVVERFGKETGIPTKLAQGTSPRWCHDCGKEHAIGEMAHGHRFAGFETPRNQSLALADTDWILWCDSDELLVCPDPHTLGKYLRRNIFQGYSIPQDHHSCDPPEGRKRDFPVRLFRRVYERPPGWVTYGPLAWPTYDPGLSVRFTGIVHEHPGTAPAYTEGLGPTIILADCWLSHEGYLSEQARRRRFVRNWPLMVADRQKYPDRRLGLFLWLRDLNHQMRYLLERSGRVLTPQAAELADECIRIFDTHFVEVADHATADALTYASVAMEVLQRGAHYEVLVKARKPELGPDEVAVAFQGRFTDFARVVKALEARAGEFGGMAGAYL